MTALALNDSPDRPNPLPQASPARAQRPARRDGGSRPGGRRPIDATIDRRLRLAQLRWGLTPRQLDVLRGLVNGLSNQDLARTLQCSLRTVEAHMTALLDRCDASSRLSMVATFWIDL
jgi:DNA-binding NarL/FixJ family response regulator